MNKARFWEQVFDKITLYPDISVHEGGDIGWAFRKNSPLLKKEIDEAADKAFNASDPTAEEAAKYVYDESGFKESLDYETTEPSGQKIVLVDAVNHALHEEMKKNKDMYIFGEDIADKKGGVFTATKGLSTTFGDDRVFNSPLAEASILGVANGMALAGLKPVVEI